MPNSHHASKAGRRSAAARSGFTLVEVLVVLAIIAMLAVYFMPRILKQAEERKNESTAKAFITTVEAALTVYQNDRKIGVYPPTTLEGFGGLGRLENRTNLGTESVFVCLSAVDYDHERALEKFQDKFENFDNDRSQSPLTVYKDNSLFEVVDPWGNPYAYFNANDYDKAEVRQYTVDADGSGESRETVTVTPWTSPKTKSYYNMSSFQLFSAGPDRKFNTDDDIGNWSW